MPRYWTQTRIITGNFDPATPDGQGTIDPSHWEKDLSLDLYVPIINVSWYSQTNAGFVELAFVALTPEVGTSGQNRIVLYRDAAGLTDYFEYTNFGNGRRVPFIGSRGRRYALTLLTRGNIGVATWSVEMWWARTGESTACPPTM